MTQNSVRIFEMSPRDGLQNEPLSIPTAAKITLINLLSKCGFADIEATSFVSPKWVPQLADGAAVMAAIDRLPSVSYAALVPNMTGFERALAAGVNSIGIFAAASQSFSQKNINCSIAESLDRFQPVMAAAAAHKIPVRGYISMVVHCPDDGDTDPQIVADLAARMMDMGCYQISLGDTVGMAKPPAIQRLLDQMCSCGLMVLILLAITMIRVGRHLPILRLACPMGFVVLMRRLVGLAAAPMRPGLPEMWQARRWPKCWPKPVLPQALIMMPWRLRQNLPPAFASQALICQARVGQTPIGKRLSRFS